MIIHDFTLPHGLQPKRNFQLTPHQQMLLMPIGDVHAFSQDWPEERVVEHIRWGVDRGAWFLGMGEYFDFTSTTQRTILTGLRESQREAIDDMVRKEVERFAVLIGASRGRWIGLLEGHHYHQYTDGTTTDQHLCRLLGAPFLGTSTLLNIRLQRGTRMRGDTGCEVIVFAHHGPGATGGRKQGGKLHRLEDLLGWIEADIYLMGHDHSKVNAPLDRLYRTRNGHLYHRTKILARTGGWLRGYAGKRPQTGQAALSRGSYVEQRALGPSSLGAPVFSLGWKRVKTGAQDIMIPDLHYSV